MQLFIRKAHRVLSMAFTMTVIANIVAMVAGSQAQWIGFLALVPLIPLLASGLYLFALPYAGKWRTAR
jgi:hypothetical protein